MAKYIVTGHVTISVHTEVEANSVAMAKGKAAEHSMMSLCHQCSGGEPSDEWVTSGDLDGAPEITGVEKV